jgi:hypothetical protein
MSRRPGEVTATTALASLSPVSLGLSKIPSAVALPPFLHHQTHFTVAAQRAVFVFSSARLHCIDRSTARQSAYAVELRRIVRENVFTHAIVLEAHQPSLAIDSSLCALQ